MSALPAAYILDSIRKLRGKARVTFPGESDDVLKVERIFSEAKNSNWRTKYPYGSADPEFPDTKLIVREQSGEDAQYVELYLAYETLPGLILSDEEYIPEIDAFITITRQMVFNSGQTGSRTGGDIVEAVGQPLVLTEYKSTENSNTLIKLTSSLPYEALGASGARTFKKSIQYSVPNEIITTPALLKAYAVKPPPDIVGTVYESQFITDYAFDYTLEQGYSGPMTAIVTRTIDLTSSEDAAILWQERADFKNVPIVLAGNQGATGMSARGKITELKFPASIHDEWEIDFGDVYTVKGMNLYAWDDAEHTIAHAGGGWSNPMYKAFGDAPITIPTIYWAMVFDIGKEPLSVTFPATSPAFIPRGDQFIAAVQSTDWRLGTFINDVYRIILPLAFPIMGLRSGSYVGAQSMPITTNTTGATIRYTTNGTIPSISNGATYIAPIAIAATKTIKARVIKAGMADGPVITEVITIT